MTNIANTKRVRKSAYSARRTYIPRPNAIHVTVYSPDGQPVPKSILNQAADAVTNIALDNGLLVGLAET